jgi:hypothetical protein
MGREDLEEQGFLAMCERQAWAVSTAQLRAAGLGDGAIEHRVRRGQLHRRHRGVFAVGRPDLSERGRLWAAVLACGGPGAAALSHGAAAAAWDLAPLSTGPIDVLTLGAGRTRPGLRVRRGGARHEVTALTDGLPVTTVTRTLLDLALVLDAHRLQRLCHRAEELRLGIDPVAPGRRGARRLRDALATVRPAAPDITRSELEERFLALIARHDLPRPHVNARVHGREVDFLWPGARLVVETDGAATHLTARVLRFTYRQTCERPEWVARTLGEVLAES